MIDSPDDLPDPVPKPLVVRARTDRDAFGELYHQTHGMIYRYCRRRLRERAAAEDACSAVFLAIAEQMHRFQGETETDFRRWAFGVARRQTASTLRQMTRQAGLLRTAARDGAVATATDDARKGPDGLWDAETDGLEQALETLSEREQTLIDLRYSEGLPHQAIANILGIRSGAVRTAISRSIAKLRKVLAASEEER